MTACLAHIRRHPIKSVGGETLSEVALTAGHRLPGDREWAILTEAGEHHAQTRDGWLPKSCFLRGVASARLQAISGGWNGDEIELTHPRLGQFSINPHMGGDALIDWLEPLWPAPLPRPTRLYHGAGVWTDQKDALISILSLDSLRDLERRCEQRLGIHRWRGNLWIEGLSPFAERTLIGEEITIGSVTFQVVDQIGRCNATCADTRTGEIDIDMLATLRQHYGHTDFGVFAKVISDGTVRAGDQVAA